MDAPRDFLPLADLLAAATPPRNSVRKILATTATANVLVQPQDVGGKAAWQLLLRDGKLAHIYADFAAAPGAHLTNEARALVLRRSVPAPYVVAGIAAAWVYAGTGPLEKLELCHRQGLRGYIPRTEAAIWSAVALDKVSVKINGLRITDHNRTIADIAARHNQSTATHWILKLVAAGADLPAARRAMERRYRVVGREQARKNLAACADLLAK